MEAEDLYRYIGNPDMLSKETLPELERMVAIYPWFHAAHILYLKNLSALEDPSYSGKLKQMVVSIPDRKRLFLLIEGRRYGIHREQEPAHKKEKEDTFSLVDDFLSVQKTANTTPSSGVAQLLIEPSALVDYIYWSLSEGLISKEKEGAPPLLHQELIDSFIEQDKNRKPGVLPEIKEKEEAVNISDNKEQDDAYLQLLDESSFTETLARIYIKQHRYEKALEIIKKLNLKYPGKNVYFADQMRFLEKLIINTKKLY